MDENGTRLLICLVSSPALKYLWLYLENECHMALFYGYSICLPWK